MKYYVGSALAILCMLFFGKIVPPWNSVTPVGVNCIGCFVGVIIAVIATGETFWPTLVAMISLTLGGYFKNFNAAISGIFGSSVVWGFFLITAIVNAMNELGAGATIASILLRRKFFQKKPLLLSYCFLGIFAITGFLMNPVGALLLGYSILSGFIDRAEVDDRDTYAQCMKLGLFLTVVLGWSIKSAVMPDFAFRFAFFEEALKGTGVTLNFGIYTLYIIITIYLFLLFFVLAMKYVFKCDFGKLSNVDFREVEEIREAKMDKYQLIFLVAFLLYAFSALIPSSWVVLKTIGQYGVAGILCLALSFMKRTDKDGNKVKLFDLTHYLQTVNWNIAIALGLFMVLGTAISSDACGIKEYLVGSFGSMLENAGSWSLTMIVILGVSLLTHVFNNSATMTIFAALAAPLSVSFAVNGTLNPSLLLATIPIGAQSGFLTTAASSTAPILYGWGVDNSFIWTKGLFTELLFIFTEILVFFVMSMVC